MPLGNKLPDSEYREWRRAHGLAEEPGEYPPRGEGGSAVIVGVGAAAIILALLGIAAAAGAKPSPPPPPPPPPGTKKKTSITVTGWDYVVYGGGYNYSVLGVLKDENGAPLSGRAIELYYNHFASILIGTGTTDSSGVFSITGFHSVPLAFSLKVKFAGDASYEASEYEFPVVLTS